MAEKSDKKPVWVEEEAHAILKRYGSLVKKPMADVASELVLQHLSELSADGPSSSPAPAAEAAVEVAAVPVAVAEVAAAPTPAPAPEPSAEELAAAAAADEADARPARRRQRIDNEDTTIQYLGGVWLV